VEGLLRREKVVVVGASKMVLVPDPRNVSRAIQKIEIYALSRLSPASVDYFCLIEE
jgi:hypothetical protein